MTFPTLKKSCLAGTALMMAGILTVTPVNAQETNNTSPEDPVSKEVQLMGTEGTELGTVTLEEGANGVLLTIDGMNMPEGEHSFHIHTTGECDPEFTAAGGHLNPDDVAHGYFAEGGPHPGDLPNIHVSADGTVKAGAYNDRVTMLGKDGKTNLLDEDGSAIMIHAKADDYISQPSGAGGDRIACAEITDDSE